MLKSTQTVPVVVSSPPEPAWKTLRKLERAYSKLSADYESAQLTIKRLQARLKEAKLKK